MRKRFQTLNRTERTTLKQAAFVDLLLCCGATAWDAEPLLWIEGEQATTRQNLVDNAGLDNRPQRHRQD